jgi:hypothetical protein
MSLSTYHKSTMNVPSGSSLKMQVNNVDVLSASGTGVAVTGTLSSSGAATVASLAVTGAITRSGVYTTGTYDQLTSTTTDVPITTKTGKIRLQAALSTAAGASVEFDITGTGLGLTSASIVAVTLLYSGTQGCPVASVVPGTNTAAITIKNSGTDALNGSGLSSLEIIYQIL